jgi:4-amino-4-deoxy-L-arabinose transferase-like glycosyltransferase
VLGATLLSSRRAGFVAGVTMASALALVVEAHLPKTDAVLLAAVVAGQLALGIVCIGARVGVSRLNCSAGGGRVILILYDLEPR